jgi:hypothetical protein
LQKVRRFFYLIQLKKRFFLAPQLKSGVFEEYTVRGWTCGVNLQQSSDKSKMDGIEFYAQYDLGNGYTETCPAVRETLSLQTDGSYSDGISVVRIINPTEVEINGRPFLRAINQD